MTKFRVGWRWYVVVLFSVPAALTLATVALAGHDPACRPSRYWPRSCPA
jgi:hypothetical protein